MESNSTPRLDKRTRAGWEFKRLSASAEKAEELARRIRIEAQSWIAPVLWHTVTKADVGKPHALGGTYLAIDVGKRLYMTQGIIQIENNEQLAKRLRGQASQLTAPAPKCAARKQKHSAPKRWGILERQPATQPQDLKHGRKQKH